MSHVNDLQVEDLPGVEPHLIDKLKRAGIKSVLDLAVSVPQELAAVGGGGGVRWQRNCSRSRDYIRSGIESQKSSH
ncbi:MAG: hypothetical protein ACJ71A_02575 [Nitrososphaeraceae archaeon]